MIRQILASLSQRRKLALQDKILWPLLGLMLVSLLVGTVTFTFATALTRDQLVAQQTDTDMQRAVTFLNGRVQEVQNAAELMARDPAVQLGVRYDLEEGLSVLNGRAVVIRDRFDLHLVQVYNAVGEARVNLVVSSLYRETSLIDRIVIDKPVVLPVDNQLLLLSRVEMPDGLGTVITGLDLETELGRFASTHRLSADLFLTAAGLQVTTNPALSFAQGQHHGYYVVKKPLMLASTPVEVALARSTADIVQVTRTGLTVMVVSSSVTGALLITLSVLLARSISNPIHKLAEAAEGLARGNLSHRVEISHSVQPFSIGHEDEIGLLTAAFNRMVSELRSLYDNLEDKVRSRTHSLNVTAQIARRVSASLNLDEVLEKSVSLIHKELSLPHVAIFMIESELNTIVLRAAAGEAGRHLQARGFRLPLSSNALVCKAVRAKETHVLQDVQADGVSYDSSFLLRTLSAAAFPLIAGESVIGVLDVQCTRPNVFTPELVNLLNTLADQIAVGLHNAQIYGLQHEMVEYLSEVDRLKNQFLAVMSHELRTPLNSIIGFSKVLMKGLSGPISDLQRNDLEVIYRSGQHLLSLIDDILDISRINAGKMDLVIESVDLALIIEGSLATARSLVQDKPVELRAEIADNMPSFLADGRRLRQIFLNLLSNAVKFTERGEIVVQAQTIRAVNLHNGEYEDMVRVSVSDTGIGIPEDKLEHIFLEFTQVDTSTTRRYQGVGLGLPITKKLIELHGGNIWVESKLGQGTTFTFVLPLRTAQIDRFLDETEQSEKELNYAV